MIYEAAFFVLITSSAGLLLSLVLMGFLPSLKQATRWSLAVMIPSAVLFLASAVFLSLQGTLT